MDENINKNKEEQPEVKEASKGSKPSNILQICLLTVFSGIFLVCAVYLAINFAGKMEGGKLYESIAEEYSVFDPSAESVKKLYTPDALPKQSASMQTLEGRKTSGTTDSETASSSAASDRLMEIRASLESLRETNPDTYGWISVSGTDINYPIAQGTDNEFYLTHSMTKSYLAIGTIFADYNCKDTVTDNFNTVFYGHNVVSTRFASSMFHDVTKFLDEEFFNNTFIYIYTFDGIYVYKPFSIYSTTSDNFYFTTDFSSEENFLDFAADVKALSRLHSDVEIGEGDTIITLSTCTNGPKNQRYALHAVLVDSIT